MLLNNLSQNTSVSDHSTTSVVGQRKIAWLLVEMFLVTVVLEWEREATNRKQGGACRHRTCPDWLKKHFWIVEDPFWHGNIRPLHFLTRNAAHVGTRSQEFS